MPHTARNHLRPIVSRRDPTRFDAWSSRGGRPEWTLGVWGSTRTRSTGALSAGRVRPSCPTRTCPAWRVRGRGAGGGVVCSGVGTHTVEPGACMLARARVSRNFIRNLGWVELRTFLSKFGLILTQFGSKTNCWKFRTYISPPRHPRAPRGRQRPPPRCAAPDELIWELVPLQGPLISSALPGLMSGALPS